MDDKFFELLKNGSQEQKEKVLKNFIQENDKPAELVKFALEDKERLWNLITEKYEKETNSEIKIKFLRILLIISRDKHGIEVLINDERVIFLFKFSNLLEDFQCEYAEATEAIKVLYNLVFQIRGAEKVHFLSNGILQIIFNKIAKFSNKNEIISFDYKNMTLKILFIITALWKESRTQVARDPSFLVIFISYLEDLMSNNEILNENPSNLISEILKIIYNILAGMNDEDQIERQKDCKFFTRLIKIIRECLLKEYDSVDNELMVKNHSINLITSIPSENIHDLMPKIIRKKGEPLVDDNFDMSSLDAILFFLQQYIEMFQNGEPNTSEVIAATLYSLIRIVKKSRIARRYIKDKILPALTKTDVLERPEVGEKLRNRLCAFFTSPIGSLAELSSNFIFILCKENVGRMVKYTGYGNSAGLLANKGLLLGKRSENESQYSTDSDSESEEYKEVKHLINGVAGKIETEKTNVFEGMTDEQKEHEAMKLVSLINELHKRDLIKPSRIGEDGKPQPIEHILELQDDE